jgi:hypothetical protein
LIYGDIAYGSDGECAMSLMNTIASALIGILFASMGLPIAAQAGGTADDISPTAKIPLNYQSWSLFLVCNPRWIINKGDQGIADLYKALQSF